MFRAIVLVALVATGFAIVLVSAPLALAFGSAPPGFTLAWFGQVVGSGDVVSDSRSVAPFRRVTVNGSTDIHVTVGGTQSVTVEAQKNIADIIETTVEDGTLVISSHGSYSSHHKTVVRITVPELEAVAIHGSSDATVDGVRGPNLDVSIRGSGDVTAAGTVEHLNYSSYGSGDAKLHDLAARDAVVRIRGSGDAHLSVSSTLDVEVSGSGDVTYSGSPKVIHQTIHGSGSISQR